MASGKLGSPAQDESSLLKEYSRARRWGLGRASQELIAWYMRSTTNLVNTDENSHRTWERRKLWHVRRAIAHALILIGVGEEQSMDFWHEVNKYWVAAGYSTPLVSDPFDQSYEQILAEVYADVVATKEDPDYQKYEAGCARMRENRLKNRQA